MVHSIPSAPLIFLVLPAVCLLVGTLTVTFSRGIRQVYLSQEVFIVCLEFIIDCVIFKKISAMC